MTLRSRVLSLATLSLLVWASLAPGPTSQGEALIRPPVETRGGGALSAVTHHFRGSARPLRALFVGASVVAGYYSSRRSTAFPAVLISLLSSATGQNVTPRVVASMGATVDTALVWALPPQQDLIVVHLVTNDFRKRVPLLRYAREYGDLLTRLRHGSPRARLLCLGTWGSGFAVNGAGVSEAEYDTVDRAQCQQSGGTFVSLTALYANPADHGPAGRLTWLGAGDQFHPDDVGHQAIARRAYATLAARRLVVRFSRG